MPKLDDPKRTRLDRLPKHVEDEEFRPGDVALRVDGRLVGAAAAPPEAAPVLQDAGDLDLDLIPSDSAGYGLRKRFAPGPVPDPEPSPLPRRRSGFPLGVAILVVVVAALGIAVWRIWPGVGTARPPPGANAVKFDSEPVGANIVVSGEVLGTTPLVMDNDFPDGRIDVRLEKPGYRPWIGKFEGGKPAEVSATLKR